MLVKSSATPSTIKNAAPEVSSSSSRSAKKKERRETKRLTRSARASATPISAAAECASSLSCTSGALHVTVACTFRFSFHVGERNAFFFAIRRDQTVEFEARHEPVCVVIREPPAIAPPSGPREGVAVARGVQADGRTQTQGVRGSSSAFRSRQKKTLLLRVVLGERVEEERERGVKRSSRLRGE